VTQLGGEEPIWGHSSSPLVLNDLVLVQGGGDIRTIAFNKFTGKIVWKSGLGLPGYAALVNMQYNNIPMILAFHGKGLAGINIQDGNELWNHPWESDYDVNATTPLVFSDKIFITSGYGTGSMLLQAGKDKVDSLWRCDEFSSIHSDPYLIDGYLYGYSGDSYQNRGSFMCIDINTGAVQWTTDEIGWGTCTYVDDYLLCCDIRGNIYLVQPHSGKFIKTAELLSALGDIRGPVWTVPVSANGRLYLRFKQKLICYNLIHR
jgi:outer membrane protein assembly factor BamB